MKRILTLARAARGVAVAQGIAWSVCAIPVVAIAGQGPVPEPAATEHRTARAHGDEQRAPFPARPEDRTTLGEAALGGDPPDQRPTDSRPAMTSPPTWSSTVPWKGEAPASKPDEDNRRMGPAARSASGGLSDRVEELLHPDDK